MKPIFFVLTYTVYVLLLFLLNPSRHFGIVNFFYAVFELKSLPMRDLGLWIELR